MILASVVSLAFIASPSPAPNESGAREGHVKPACVTNACRATIARRACDRGSVRMCIRRAALHHGVSEPRLVAVAWCESRLNPGAVNGQYWGLFQFGYALWSELPYRSHSRFSAKWSSLAAAYAFRRGLSFNWECA